MVNSVIKVASDFIKSIDSSIDVSNEMLSIDTLSPTAVYAVISVRERSETAVSKTCNDYSVLLSIKIYQSQRKGFFSNALSAQLEDTLSKRFKELDFSSTNLARKNISFEGSDYNRVETDTKTASVITMNFNLWLAEK